MNLNSSDTTDPDRFKNYCQAVKSKVPVFYERVNLLISDKTDSYFDGSRAISIEDPDCQKNYNVFVGCISFKEKQMMSQREFLNRIQFDNLDGGFDQTNSIAPTAPDQHAHNSTATDPDRFMEQSSIVAGDFTSNNETDLLESLRESSLLIDSMAINDTAGANDDCDSAMVDDDDVSQLHSTANESTMNQTSQLDSTEQNTLTESSLALDGTMNESEIVNSTAITNDESTANASQIDISNINDDAGNCDAQDSTLNLTMNSTQEMSNINDTTLTNGTVNDDTQMNATGANETLANDSQIDVNATTGSNETQETIQNDSAFPSAGSMGDSTNIFRIKEEYLKLDYVFRLPLSVLQQEVNIKLNVFGIPFGRLRRQVKFALPKDFDPFRTVSFCVFFFHQCGNFVTQKKNVYRIAEQASKRC